MCRYLFRFRFTQQAIDAGVMIYRWSVIERYFFSLYPRKLLFNIGIRDAANTGAGSFARLIKFAHAHCGCLSFPQIIWKQTIGSTENGLLCRGLFLFEQVRILEEEL